MVFAFQKAAPWLSVPQFGDWDQKGQLPDYSLDFSKIREMRKQNKTNLSRASLGNEEELMASTTAPVNTGHNDEHQDYHRNHDSPTVRFSVRFFILDLLAAIYWTHESICTTTGYNEDNSIQGNF